MPKRKDSGLRARWPVRQHSAMLSAVFWLPNKKKIWKHTVRMRFKTASGIAGRASGGGGVILGFRVYLFGGSL